MHSSRGDLADTYTYAAGPECVTQKSDIYTMSVDLGTRRRLSFERQRENDEMTIRNDGRIVDDNQGVRVV